MDINQIRYALKVMETKNFLQAAEQLYITQPTLSQQIHKLEEELGVKLFERNTRNFKITPAGQEFQAMGTKVINSFVDLSNSMLKFRTKSGFSLTIGILPTIAKIGILPLISNFMKIYPECKIDLIETYSEIMIEMILSNTIDIAILNKIDTIPSEKEERLFYAPLIEDQMVLLCNKNSELALKDHIKIEELINYPIIKLASRTSVSIIMKNIFKKYSISPNYAMECHSTSNMIAMVEEGIGVSFLSETIAFHYATEKISVVKIVPKIPNVTAIVALKKKVKNKFVNNFIEYLKKENSIVLNDSKENKYKK